jgi:hypothetical protein
MPETKFIEAVKVLEQTALRYEAYAKDWRALHTTPSGSAYDLTQAEEFDGRAVAIRHAIKALQTAWVEWP